MRCCNFHTTSDGYTTYFNFIYTVSRCFSVGQHGNSVLRRCSAFKSLFRLRACHGRILALHLFKGVFMQRMMLVSRSGLPELGMGL